MEGNITVAQRLRDIIRELKSQGSTHEDGRLKAMLCTDLERASWLAEKFDESTRVNQMDAEKKSEEMSQGQ